MRAPLPPEIVYSIRLSTWHALFAARGYPPGVTPATDSLPPIAEAFAGADLPLSLARASFAIAAFASDAARANIYGGAEAVGYEGRWPDATSPADLIAGILATSETDPALAQVVTAAVTMGNRAFRPRSTHLFVGAADADPLVGEPTQYADAWRAELTALATRRDFGKVAGVDARAIAGTLAYELVHEDRAETVLVAAPDSRDGAPFRAITQRPVRSHRVVYEPQRRRLWITTDLLQIVIPLAQIAGRVFFGRTRHFLDEAALDLWRLQEHGADALVVRELLTKLIMKAVGGTWDSGKSHAVSPRGKDFFKALERYKIRIEGGRLDLLTLRGQLLLLEGGPRECDIAVRPPHLLTVSEPEVAPLMHAFLDYAKITSPEPRPSDFFSLQPWRPPAPTWIASEGEEGFERLVTNGLLVADPTNRAIASPDHPHAGPVATAYPLSGSKFLCWSADLTIAPFVVEEADLVVYALSFTKLARMVADTLGLESPATKLDDDGVLYCGRRTLGPTYVLLFLLTRPIRPATAARLREAAGHGHAIVIAPEGRGAHGLRQVAMPKLSAPWRPLLAAIVRALRLEAFVDTPLYAPEGARIVLHAASMRIWIDGLLCTLLTELHYRLLEILIPSAGTPVHSKDIAEHVAQGNQHRDTTRRTVESLLGAISKSFAASKRRPPADLAKFITQTTLGRYVLNVPGFID